MYPRLLILALLVAAATATFIDSVVDRTGFNFPEGCADVDELVGAWAGAGLHLEIYGENGVLVTNGTKIPVHVSLICNGPYRAGFAWAGGDTYAEFMLVGVPRDVWSETWDDEFRPRTAYWTFVNGDNDAFVLDEYADVFLPVE